MRGRRWLKNPARERVTALGDAEEVIPRRLRVEAASRVPAGWRLTRDSDARSGYVLSRLLGLEVQVPVLSMATAAARCVVSRRDEENASTDARADTVLSYLYGRIQAHEGSPVVRVQAMQQLLDVMYGTAICAPDAAVEAVREALRRSDADDGNLYFGRHVGIAASIDDGVDAVLVRGTLRGVRADDVTPDSISAAVASVTSCSTVQPYFDGAALRESASEYVAHYAALRVVKCLSTACVTGRCDARSTLAFLRNLSRMVGVPYNDAVHTHLPALYRVLFPESVEPGSDYARHVSSMDSSDLAVEQYAACACLLAGSLTTMAAPCYVASGDNLASVCVRLVSSLARDCSGMMVELTGTYLTVVGTRAEDDWGALVGHVLCIVLGFAGVSDEDAHSAVVEAVASGDYRRAAMEIVAALGGAPVDDPLRRMQQQLSRVTFTPTGRVYLTPNSQLLVARGAKMYLHPDLAALMFGGREYAEIALRCFERVCDPSSVLLDEDVYALASSAVWGGVGSIEAAREQMTWV